MWRVHAGEAPEEYGDAERFFDITYMTGNMRQILSDVEEKLKHGEGDAFKQIETPFGGGKTHTMIAAYHKAKKLGVKIVVIDGMRLSADDTLWGVVEEQLDGKIKTMSGYTSPKTGDLEKLLQRKEPVLILIDELLAYMITADGKMVGKTTLGDQTKIFIQKLGAAVSKTKRVCVISTFLSGGDEYMVNKKTQANVDDLIRVVKKISGRQDHKVTPVSPDDVPNVIRRRLFVTPESELEKGAETDGGRIRGLLQAKRPVAARHHGKAIRGKVHEIVPVFAGRDRNIVRKVGHVQVIPTDAWRPAAVGDGGLPHEGFRQTVHHACRL